MSFFLNGTEVPLEASHARLSLVDYLRTVQAKTGTKVSCAQGGCGACTVVVTHVDPVTKETVDRSVPSCLTPVGSLAGCAVTTVEGIGRLGELHPVQERIAKNNGTQCGFCTPGMVMSMYGLLKETQGKPALSQVDARLDGNICRCTGYRAITGACQTFAVDEGAPKPQEAWAAYQPATHDAPTPAGLAPLAGGFALQAGGWYRPGSLGEVQKLRASLGAAARIANGNTGPGVFPELNRGITAWVDIRGVPELHQLAWDADASVLRAGGCVTLSALSAQLRQRIAAGDGVQALGVLLDHLQLIAGHHVRNAATLAGNIQLTRQQGFGSDVGTLLLGLGASLRVLEATGTDEQELSIDAFFAAGPEPDWLITSISIPVPKGPHTSFHSYRTALRKVNAHALVNAAFLATVNPQDGVVTQARIAYGVVGPVPRRSAAGEAALQGNAFTPDSFAAVLAAVRSDIQPAPESQYHTLRQGQGKDAYRAHLVAAFLAMWFKARTSPGAAPLQLKTQARAPATDTVDYELAPGRTAMPKLGVEQQASGQAVYTDDIPEPRGTLYGALVLAPPDAPLMASLPDNVDWSPLLGRPGVVDVVTAADVKGANSCGAAPGEETVFLGPGDALQYPGQPVALVLARTQQQAIDAAATAAGSLKIAWAAPATNPVLSIADAAAAESFLAGAEHSLQCGDTEAALRDAEVTLSGQTTTQSQAHFYMEQQTCLVIPDEGLTQFQVYVGNQAPDYTRSATAAILGVQGNAVNIRNRRTGGGFGGKITRQMLVLGASAVAAQKTGVPVKTRLPINTDLTICAGRHEVQATWTVGATKQGKITALKVDTLINGGHSHDFTGGVVLEFNESLDSVYHIPNMDCKAKAVKTNSPSRTAARSFGHSQSIWVTEDIIVSLAHKLGLPVEQVRAANHYTARNCIAPTGQHMEGCNIVEMWDQLKASAEWEQRTKQVQQWNAQHKWRKRAISMLGSKYGLCQAYSMGTQALVNVNGDGTVVVYQGGTEIGQGLYTKVAQTVSMTLGCPLESVKIADTETDACPNSMFTGGSTASEANLEAARLACVKLNNRLDPFRLQLLKDDPDSPPTWAAVVAAAKAKTTLLSAVANYVPLGRKDTKKMNPWVVSHAEAFAFCVGCTEVEVNLLTGETSILRADILYDSGTSINPTIDVGQAQGAFMMGVGYFLQEEVLQDAATGRVNSSDTWEYKPPSVLCGPQDFRVSLLKGSKHAKGVMGQKGIGEPPMCLAASAATAVRQAIATSRQERGLDALVAVDCPLTVDRVAMAAEIADEHMVAALSSSDK